MRMVDGVLLLVDAKEGPMPQTKFVLRKAIQAGHKIIVVINKIDKPAARCEWALNATFDLFIELGATDDQINFPVIYAVGSQGIAGLKPDIAAMKDIQPVFEKIVEYIPEPKIDPNAPLQFLTVNLAYDNYKGKIAIGRLYSGTMKKGMRVLHVNRKGVSEKIQLSSVMLFDGLAKVDTEIVETGDIAAISGIPSISIGETITDIDNPVPLPVIQIDEPTIKMTFGINTSPLPDRKESTPLLATLKNVWSASLRQMWRSPLLQLIRPTAGRLPAAESSTSRSSSKKCGARAMR